MTENTGAPGSGLSRSAPGAPPHPTASEILGAAELAALAGVSVRTLSAYLSRGQCPEPDWRLACGPVWRSETVAAWLEARAARRDRDAVRNSTCVED